jgi:hypothetical protein
MLSDSELMTSVVRRYKLKIKKQRLTELQERVEFEGAFIIRGACHPMGRSPMAWSGWHNMMKSKPMPV